MKNLIIFLFGIVTVFFQLSVEGIFFSNYRIPDLTLAFVITLVLAMGFKKSFKWILLTGLLVDAGSSAVFGTAALAFFLIGWMISRFAAHADMRSRKIFFLASFAVIVAISEVVKDFFILASLKIKADFFHEIFNAPFHIFSLDYFLKIFYTIFSAYAVYYIFRRVSRALFLEPVKLAKRIY